MRGLRDKGKEIKNKTAKVLLNLKEPIDQIAPFLLLTSVTKMCAMPIVHYKPRPPGEKEGKKGGKL